MQTKPFTCIRDAKDQGFLAHPVSFLVGGMGRVTWWPDKARRLRGGYDPYWHDTAPFWQYPGKGYPRPADSGLARF